LPKKDVAAIRAMAFGFKRTIMVFGKIIELKRFTLAKNYFKQNQVFLRGD
jgi:hypothetical protein